MDVPKQNWFRYQLARFSHNIPMLILISMVLLAVLLVLPN